MLNLLCRDLLIDAGLKHRIVGAGVKRHSVQLRFFLIRKKRHLIFLNLVLRLFQHLAAAGLQGHSLDFLHRRLTPARSDKFFDLSVDLFPAPGTAFQQLIRNPLDLKSGDFTFVRAGHFNFISEPEALPRQGILVTFPRIADCPVHFRGIQRLIRAVRVRRDIDDHIVRMQLGIKQTAVVVMILRIDNLAGIGEVFRRVIIAPADPDCGKAFQFPHPDFDRFPVSFHQTGIEQRHHRNRFLSRTLKIVKTDRMGIVPRSQLFTGERIEVLLKQRKGFRSHLLPRQTERRRKLSHPATFHTVMLAVIVVVGKMLPIKIGALAMSRFNFCPGKHASNSDPAKP